MASIWTVWRVYPERGRVRLGDWTGEDLALEHFRRHVGLAASSGTGRVELRCDGVLMQRWAAGFGPATSQLDEAPVSGA